jgi:glycosyltransferase involved in cell wall biosynthesis
MSEEGQRSGVVADEPDADGRDPRPSTGADVALVHDYLTQRGGAERLLLLMMEAFPDARVHTSLYFPEGTYPELGAHHLVTAPLNRLGPLRVHHRAAFPLLAPTFSAMRIDAPITLCSSSGWAHGVHATGRKIVYCHSPARWLYRPQQYLRDRRGLPAIGLRMLRRPLAAWDQRAAASADRYLTNSALVRDLIRDVYGRDAEVVHPPATLDPNGPQEPVVGLEPGFYLCVSRLVAHKNLDVVIDAVGKDRRLVVVGDGPEAERLRVRGGDRVLFLRRQSDAELRWLYANSAALISASYEDFGITTIEAAGFGVPTIALRYGGFLDTVAAHQTGEFFDKPEAAAIGEAIRRFERAQWDRDAIAAHGAKFSANTFKARLRTIVAEEARLA